MSEIIYKDTVGKAKLLPFTGIQFFTFDVLDAIDTNLVFHRLESESSWSIKAVSKPTFWGGQRTLGYNVDINVYLPLNYGDFLSGLGALDTLVFKKHFTYQLLLGAAAATNIETVGYTPPATINNTGSGWLYITPPKQIDVAIEIESVEFRPRTIIRIQHFIKTLSSITFTIT